MSTIDQIDHAVDVLGLENLLVLQCTSAYPTKYEELNLRAIQAYQERYSCPVGFSAHTMHTHTTLASVAIGACYVEHHITLDRKMWGTDQAFSLEPDDFKRLVQSIREIEVAMGDGVKRVYDNERPHLVRLRAQPEKS